MPQYEFGTGLSYTTFKYSNIKIDKKEISSSDEITVTVEVTNSGFKEGKESVLLYLSDNVASITPEFKSLKRFEKVNLAPSETKTITFTLTPQDLKFVNNDLKWISEKGTYTIQIGNQKVEFLLQ